MASVCTFTPKTIFITSTSAAYLFQNPRLLTPNPSSVTPFNSLTHRLPSRPHSTPRDASNKTTVRAALDGNYQSSKRSGSSNDEPRETIMLPGCDFNRWLIVMEFPKDPAPAREEQMMETYLSTLATVLGRLPWLSLGIPFLFYLCSKCWNHERIGDHIHILPQDDAI